MEITDREVWLHVGTDKRAGLRVRSPDAESAKYKQSATTTFSCFIDVAMYTNQSLRD